MIRRSSNSNMSRKHSSGSCSLCVTSEAGKYVYVSVVNILGDAVNLTLYVRWTESRQDALLWRASLESNWMISKHTTRIICYYRSEKIVSITTDTQTAVMFDVLLRVPPSALQNRKKDGSPSSKGKTPPSCINRKRVRTLHREKREDKSHVACFPLFSPVG